MERLGNEVYEVTCIEFGDNDKWRYMARDISYQILVLSMCLPQNQSCTDTHQGVDSNLL